jgi:hypothetical protein
MMMNKEKDFDAVEMMRSIRSRLQKKYTKDPDLMEKRLTAIRKKYSRRSRRKVFSDPRHVQ